ncbi:phytoene desaturase family protein [Mucilaginibacter polytrichastri]|uniref:Protein p49 n=1 Tax=Mucilaginibacter polytrichastri TaxID=1302689 RepID=A0A1Q5ZVP8_9SPHI|nr:NAD(P)/FAD-dependent oxidoreductase [Mucilaginibacter polytrichastri]OKS85816.1 Protein p49 [Mucilaginibacter polytrichastri]SFS61307.1 Phytoene dehydrogenase-related protein [Mucilaginibacter polytrichastri]
MTKRDYDAVVVGSGPNGLAAAITMQQAGLAVLLLEGKDTIGGGLRTAELTLPGFKHDICSAIHPLAVSSPFFKSLPLAQYGLEFIYSPYAAAHPLDDGTAAILQNSLTATAAGLGDDESAYLQLLQPLLKSWPDILPDVLAPLQWPRHPFKLAGFGVKGLRSAEGIARQYFKTAQAQALWAGMAAHGMQPLHKPVTAAVALVLLLAAHDKGWPIPKGGSQQIADALAAHFVALGGKIETGTMVSSLKQLPGSHAVLFDVGPRQLLQIAGHSLSAVYQWQLNRYKYGMGVYKVDWALAEPIPFTAEACKQAGTVHIGGTYAEVAASEQAAWQGEIADKPFVLLAQQSLFDNTRAPSGQHTAWGYCHTPNGSVVNMTEAIEKQIERFAPGFRERILAKHGMDSQQMEAYNPNYFGGDINGGIQNIAQLFTRPALRLSPYRTSAKGLYICSASTPPGGGVHGMCGYYAAKRALKDVFKIA